MVGQKHFIFMDAKDTAVLSMNELYSLIANTEFPCIGIRYEEFRRHIRECHIVITRLMLKLAERNLRDYYPPTEQIEVYATIRRSLTAYLENVAKFSSDPHERFLRAVMNRDPFLLGCALRYIPLTSDMNVFLLSTISLDAAVALAMKEYETLVPLLTDKKKELEGYKDEYARMIIVYVLRTLFNPVEHMIVPLFSVIQEEKEEEEKEPGGVVVVKEEEHEEEEDSADEDIICHETSPHNRGNQETGARKLKLPDEVYERKNGAWNRKAYDKARQPLAYARKLLRGINPYDEVSEALKVLKSPPNPEVAIEILSNFVPSVQNERDSKHIMTAIEYLKKFQEVTASSQ